MLSRLFKAFVALVLFGLSVAGALYAVQLVRSDSRAAAPPRLKGRGTVAAAKRIEEIKRRDREGAGRFIEETPEEQRAATVVAPLSALERRYLTMKADHLAPPRSILEQAIQEVPGAGDRIVLTFDDGPSKNTPEILSILRRYGAHATFFFVGRRAEADPQALRATLAQGSEIGNHTLDHVSLLAQTRAWDQREIQGAEDVFYRIAHVRPLWVRPQSGWADQTGVNAITGMRKRFVHWNDFGSDTVSDYTAYDIEHRTVSLARPGGIILLHETNPLTIEALPGILERLQRRGLKVVTMTEAWHAAGYR